MNILLGIEIFVNIFWVTKKETFFALFLKMNYWNLCFVIQLTLKHTTIVTTQYVQLL